jgi:hypothetical protein
MKIFEVATKFGGSVALFQEEEEWQNSEMADDDAGSAAPKNTARDHP